VTLDVSTDYKIADNTEPVTVITKRASGNTSISVTGALRRAVRREHQFFGGVSLQGDELIWNIPDGQLSGAELQKGDTITDAQSVVWTILSVAILTFGSRWRAVCRQER
jgi:hypothetical protein